MKNQNPTPTHIKFDVMLRGRFIATMHMPLYMADGIDTDGSYIISEQTVSRYVLSKRPTLKNQPFNICF